MTTSIEFRTMRGRLEAENGWVHYTQVSLPHNRRTMWQRLRPYRLALASKLIKISEHLIK